MEANFLLIIYFVFFAIVPAVHTQIVLTIDGGSLTDNTTYGTNENIVRILNDLTVPKGVTLTLMPGVRLQFAPRTKLVVKGILIAKVLLNILFSFFNCVCVMYNIVG